MVQIFDDYTVDSRSAFMIFKGAKGKCDYIIYIYYTSPDKRIFALHYLQLLPEFKHENF